MQVSPERSSPLKFAILALELLRYYSPELPRLICPETLQVTSLLIIKITKVHTRVHWSTGPRPIADTQLVHAVFWQAGSRLPSLFVSACQDLWGHADGMWHALNLQHNLWQISRPLWPLSTQMALSMRAGTLLHWGAQLSCQLIAIFLHKVQSTSHSSMSGLYYCPRQHSYPQFGKTQHGEKQPTTTAKVAFEREGHTVPHGVCHCEHTVLSLLMSLQTTLPAADTYWWPASS